MGYGGGDGGLPLPGLGSRRLGLRRSGYLGGRLAPHGGRRAPARGGRGGGLAAVQRWNWGLWGCPHILGEG